MNINHAALVTANSRHLAVIVFEHKVYMLAMTAGVVIHNSIARLQLVAAICGAELTSVTIIRLETAYTWNTPTAAMRIS